MLNFLKIDRKIIKYLDVGAIIVALIIVIFGTLNIFSATQPVNKGYVYYKFIKIQAMWIFICLAVLYIVLVIDYTIIGNYVGLIYWASIALLIINKLYSAKVNGQANWIKLGPITLQPSEFAKIALILLLAKKLDDMEGKINDPRNFFILIAYVLVPLALILPDMGLTMIIFFTVLGIVFIIGLDFKVIFGGIAALIAGVMLIWNTNILGAHVKDRFTSFLDPSVDPLGTSYQLIQSKIAIGSGGLLGKGFMQGTRVHGGFVPFAYTDFIFAVVCEEWGLIGAGFLFLMYAILFLKFIKIAKNSKDIFGTLLCVGIISSFLFSIIQNAGMTVGIMPISGITLPFMSYGGSSLLTNFISLGLVLNVGMRKKKINF